MCPVASRATAAIAAIRLTLADLVRAHGDAYRRTHRLATVQTRALRAIAACRTALMGGRRETCDHCGAYNPHSRRRSHAIQFNEVYPPGPAHGHVPASSAGRIKPSSLGRRTEGSGEA